MIAVVENQVFAIGLGLNFGVVGQLQTSTGDVYIAENNNGEIGIVDGVILYVYNYLTGTFKVSGTDFWVSS